MTLLFHLRWSSLFRIVNQMPAITTAAYNYYTQSLDVCCSIKHNVYANTTLLSSLLVTYNNCFNSPQNTLVLRLPSFISSGIELPLCPQRVHSNFVRVSYSAVGPPKNFSYIIIAKKLLNSILVYFIHNFIQRVTYLKYTAASQATAGKWNVWNFGTKTYTVYYSTLCSIFSFMVITCKLAVTVIDYD